MDHPANQRQHVPQDLGVARILFSWALPTITLALGREPHAGGKAEWVWRNDHAILVLEEFATLAVMELIAAQLVLWYGQIPGPQTGYPCNLILDGTPVFNGRKEIIWGTPHPARNHPRLTWKDPQALQRAVSWFRFYDVKS